MHYIHHNTVHIVMNCVKDWAVCGTVYDVTHYKVLLGSIIRVGYCIAVLDFYLVLHGRHAEKAL